MTTEEFAAYKKNLHTQIKEHVMQIKNEHTRIAAYRHSIMKQLEHERTLFTGPQVTQLIFQAIWPHLEEIEDEESDWETLGRIMKETKEA